MIKEIRYGGLTAQPNEYISEDGELAMAMNLIPEHGGLRPVKKGTTIHESSEGTKPLYIHNSSRYKHMIYCDNSNVYWAEMSKDDNSFTESTENKVTALEEGEMVKGIVAIGNTLIITTTKSMRYVLWRDEKYVDLGSKLPFVNIEFNMAKGETFTSKTLYSEFDNIPYSIMNDAVNGSDSNYKNAEETEQDKKNAMSRITEAIYGLYLSLSASVSDKKLFSQPFFIRTAIRLYDNSYVMHSAPILMMPTIMRPRVEGEQRYIKSDENSTKLKTTSIAYLDTFKLQWRILDDANTLWDDIIAGIDIFITSPIYTWKQGEDMSPTELFVNSLSLGKGYFGGHCDGEDWYETPSDNWRGKYWNIKANDMFEEDIKEANLFYKIKSCEWRSIVATDQFEDLRFDVDNFNALATLPTLKDDYNSHSRLVGDFQFVYNNRLNLGNVEYFPGDTLPIKTMGPYVKSQDNNFTPVKIDVWIKKEGKDIIASQIINQEASETNPYAIASNPSSGVALPRFLFYPDANAYKIKIQGANILRSYNLKPHDFLNGAYWWGGLDINLPTEMTPIPSEDVHTTGIYLGNKLFTSEAENPWVFPPEGTRTIGDGELVGIATASKALSEGQFGAFPLYAFTTEGVWSLAVNADGTFNPAQPITRDVCISADSITQIDQSVLFATDRGVMMIQGSNTICLTDKIDSDEPLILTDLQGGEKLINLSGINENAFTIKPFKEFLHGSSMVYDYKNQRIILYNKDCKYAYVYSFDTKTWGMMESNIKDSVNSYPDAIVVTDDNHLVNLSEEDINKANGLMITRALKLDGPDILKTIDTIIQRGNFNRGDVSTILWGSRDLKNWHLVWSSKDHFMRGFRGTPYKYYRIGALTNLGKDENLVGASINHTPKQTNQIR